MFKFGFGFIAGGTAGVFIGMALVGRGIMRMQQNQGSLKQLEQVAQEQLNRNAARRANMQAQQSFDMSDVEDFLKRMSG